MCNYIITTDTKTLVLDNEEIVSIEIKEYVSYYSRLIKKIFAAFNIFLKEYDAKIILKTKTKIIEITYNNHNKIENLSKIVNDDYNQIKTLLNKEDKTININGNISKIKNKTDICKLFGLK
jgi:DNA-binding transcriptional regulator GbsR (MarR family)